jgi:RimJ/RimL family protein N-acetyltransferase
VTPRTPAPSGAPVPLPDPPLVDGELRLRPWTLDDAPALVAAWGDPEVARWTGVPPVPDDAAARRWIAGDDRRRATRLSLDLVVEVGGVLAGEVGLTGLAQPGVEAELGWWVAAEHRGGGIATRAVRLVADWALGALQLPSLRAICDPANPASAAVARNAGFVAVDPEAPQLVSQAARSGQSPTQVRGLWRRGWGFEGPDGGGTLHP